MIILAFLSGWLVTELKDFFSQGGYTNGLGLSLLKIIFISFFMLATGGMALSATFFKAVLFRLTPQNGGKKGQITSTRPSGVFSNFIPALDDSTMSYSQTNGE